MEKSSYATKKRSMILEYLKEHSEKDVSVKEIEEGLNQKSENSINMTTIYRYLDKLAGEGTVLKHTSENGKQSTFQYVEPEAECVNHLHMKCSSCGRIYHINCAFMDEIRQHIYSHHKFMIECKSSMLYGICENCRLNNGGEKGYNSIK
jgi:Fur family ferric uptake transcriptional regulator